MLRALTLMTLLCVTLFCVIPATAFAANGDACMTDTSNYLVRPTDLCYLICSRAAAGGATSCTPSAQLDLTRAGSCSFSVGRTVGTCDGSVIPIEESDGTGAAPNVWHTITTLTGPTSPYISEYVMPRRPKSQVRVSGMTLAGGCTALDVIVSCEIK